MSTLTKPRPKTLRARAAVRPAPQPAKLRLSARNRAAIKLLESWMNATPEEIEDQRETLELLQRAQREYPVTFRRVEI